MSFLALAGFCPRACRVAFACFLAVASSLASAVAPGAIPVPATGPALLHEASLFWRDSRSAASLDGALEALARGDFTPLSGPLGLGYVEETVWLYFELELEGPFPEGAPYFLEVLPPSLDVLTLYTEDRTGAWYALAVRGDKQPQATAPFPYRHPLFPLALHPGRQAFLLSLQSQGPLQGVLKLWPQTAWQAEARQSYLWLGLRYGVGFLFFFVNLAYWVVFRRSMFGVFVAWLIISGLHWASMDGLAAEFLFPNEPAWLDGSQAVLACLLTSASWAFFSAILEFKARYPWFHRAARVGIALGVVAALGSLVGLYKTLAPLLQLYAALGFIPLALEVRRLWPLGGDSRFLAATLLSYPFLLAVQIGQGLLAGGFSEYSVTLFVLAQGVLMLASNIATSLQAQATRQETRALRLAAWASEQEQARLTKARRERDSLLLALAEAIERPLARIESGREALAGLSMEDGGLGPEEGARLSTLRQAADRLSLLAALTTKPDTLLPTALRAERLSVSDWVFQTLLLLPQGQRRRLVPPAQAEFLLFRGDRRLLGFALLNALENALRYSPADSPVRLEVRAEPRKGLAGFALSVHNEGPPLSDAECAALFEKYARGPRSRGQGGLGLGLFLVRNIVKAHGGKVMFSPGLEEGVELRIWLPKGAA